MKPIGERRIELATWGALAVWLGVMLIVDEKPGVTAVGSGGILLASALLQRAMRYEAGLFLWAFGLYFVITGIGDLADVTETDVPFLAIVLIGLGALLMVRAFAGKSWGSGSRVPRTRGQTPLD
jgi:hypothetical protein